jgi:hypothetical protein
LTAGFGFWTVFVPAAGFCPGESGIESLPVRTPVELAMHFLYGFPVG